MPKTASQIALYMEAASVGGLIVLSVPASLRFVDQVDAALEKTKPRPGPSYAWMRSCDFCVGVALKGGNAVEVAQQVGNLVSGIKVSP
jgi:hypothetical protein